VLKVVKAPSLLEAICVLMPEGRETETVGRSSPTVSVGVLLGVCVFPGGKAVTGSPERVKLSVEVEVGTPSSSVQVEVLSVTGLVIGRVVNVGFPVLMIPEGRPEPVGKIGCEPLKGTPVLFLPG